MASRGRYRSVHDQLAAAQKPRRGQIYSVMINRPAGRRLAALAFILGLTPNQVSLISAAFSGAGIALLAAGPTSVATGLGVTALLVLGYAMDAADGQLARLRGGGSAAGEWLDHMVDAAKVVALHQAAAIHLYRTDDVDKGWLLVPLGFAVVAAYLFASMILRDLLGRSAGRPRAKPQGDQSILYMFATLPRDYGALCFVFALIGWPQVFVVVYATLFALNLAINATATPKWFREMQALDTPKTD